MNKNIENRVFFYITIYNIQYYHCYKRGMKFIVSSDYKISDNLF